MNGVLHFVFEALAYAVGLRLFLRARRRSNHPVAQSADGTWVAVGAILGAALGSKIVWWMQVPDYAFGFGAFAVRGFDPQALLAGKTIVGGLLGGVFGVELAKWRIGLRESTGDLFAGPVMLGLAIGRIGCFFGGLGDGTCGNPTSLPWGYNFGDAIPRHPTMLYEIVFVGLVAGALRLWGDRLKRQGDRFRVFLSAYLTFRFAVEFLKAPHGGFPPALASLPVPRLYGEGWATHASPLPIAMDSGVSGITGIQVVCLLGLGYYLIDFYRARRALRARGGLRSQP